MNNSNNENISMTKTFTTLIKNEGPFVLFRGFLPSYLRLGPHALICFPVFEKLRLLVGLDNF